MMTRRQFEEGDFVLEQGEPLNAMCLIESGTVAIYRDVTIRTTSHTPVRMIYYHSTGLC